MAFDTSHNRKYNLSYSTIELLAKNSGRSIALHRMIVFSEDLYLLTIQTPLRNVGWLTRTSTGILVIVHERCKIDCTVSKLTALDTRRWKERDTRIQQRKLLLRSFTMNKRTIKKFAGQSAGTFPLELSPIAKGEAFCYIRPTRYRSVWSSVRRPGGSQTSRILQKFLRLRWLAKS